MKWFQFQWHTFWFNYHNQLRGDALDSFERSRQQVRMYYHGRKLAELLYK